MGFHLRKSFNFGGLRFNLSNSGIGVSTGIKGLRVGIDGKGRAYTAGGIGALRFRENLTSSPRKSPKTSFPVENFTIQNDVKIINSHEIPDKLRCRWWLPLLLIPSAFLMIFVTLPFLVMGDFQNLKISLLLDVFLSVPWWFVYDFYRSTVVSSAVTAYNHGNYDFAQQKFLKAETMAKRLDWLTRNFLYEGIYNCYVLSGKYEEAVNYLLNDCQTIVKRSDRIIGLYALLGQHDKLIDYYNDNPLLFHGELANDVILDTIFDSFVNLERWAEALEYCLKNSDIPARNDKIIKCYQKLEQYKELVNFIQKEITASEKEENPLYYAYLGEAFLKLNQPEIALETLLQGPALKRSMDVGMCAYRYQLGLCYEAVNDFKNALKQYQKIYTYDIDYKDVTEKIERIGNAE